MVIKIPSQWIQTNRIQSLSEIDNTDPTQPFFQIVFVDISQLVMKRELTDYTYDEDRYVASDDYRTGLYSQMYKDLQTVQEAILQYWAGVTSISEITECEFNSNVIYGL